MIHLEIVVNQLIKCKFEWKVVNLRQIYEAVQPGIKTQLISSRFPGFHEVAWELVIEIHKIKNYEEKETVNIWLRQVGPCAIDDFNCRNPFAKNYVTNTKYKIYVIKDNNFTIISRFLKFFKYFSDIKQACQGVSKNKLEDQQQIGYVQVLLDDVLSKAGAWFPNFKLLEGLQLYCEVKLVYLDSLEILQKKYASMFYNNKFTDCVFKIGDKTIKAHRCVLVQSSEVFKKMFGDTGMIEATTGEVTITDATPECFRQFLSYLYTAKIFKYTFKKYVEDLFSLAHKYQVETLQYECERYMASLLSLF
ncbi:unnamed protein product [Meloidogyne enterolobii]|uniref:Uncharacterized protein n=1 Tax=Meloidogyne enterolobii TaxID=390850 RepID=A0ACB1AAD7_MELEN